MQDFTSVDSKVLSDPHWRARMQGQAGDALRRAGSNNAVIAKIYDNLLAKVPPGNTPASFEAMSKLVRVMNAFAGLSPEQKDILQGIVHHTALWRLNGVQQIEYKLKAGRDVWQSHPELAALQDEFDAEAARSEAEAASQRAAHQAAIEAAQQRRAEAPGIIIAWHKRGFRLEVADDGRAMIWPDSLLTPEDRNLLASHSRELGQTLRAEWVKG